MYVNIRCISLGRISDLNRLLAYNANRRLDLVRLCPDRLKANRLLFLSDLGRAATNPIVY